MTATRQMEVHVNKEMALARFGGRRGRNLQLLNLIGGGKSSICHSKETLSPTDVAPDFAEYLRAVGVA